MLGNGTGHSKYLNGLNAADNGTMERGLPTECHTCSGSVQGLTAGIKDCYAILSGRIENFVDRK